MYICFLVTCIKKRSANRGKKQEVGKEDPSPSLKSSFLLGFFQCVIFSNSFWQLNLEIKFAIKCMMIYLCESINKKFIVRPTSVYFFERFVTSVFRHLLITFNENQQTSQESTIKIDEKGKNTKIFTSSVYTPVKLGIENNFYEDLNVDIFSLFLARFLNAIFRVTFMFFAISNIRRLFILTVYRDQTS